MIPRELLELRNRKGHVLNFDYLVFHPSTLLNAHDAFGVVLNRKRNDPAYLKIGRQIELYSRSKTLKNLAGVVDSMIAFAEPHVPKVYSAYGGVNGKYGPFASANDLVTYAEQKLAKSGHFNRARQKWDSLDKDKLWISSEDAKTLEAHVNGENEFGGGAKFVTRNGKTRIVPHYSNARQFRRFAPLFYQSFLESQSHLPWHTHPSRNDLPENYKYGFFSRDDRKNADRLELPLFLACKVGGTTRFFVYSPDSGKTHEVQVK